MSETTEITTTEQALNTTPAVGIADIWLDKDRFDQAARTAAAFARSDIVPQNYQGKPENCLIALDVAARMGMSPITVMQNLWVVKGKPSWSGQMCMSMIQGCGKYTNVTPVYFGQEGTDGRGCYISAVRVSDGEVVNGTKVTMAMAKSEGWTTNSKWKNMPEQMLGYRAAAFFARLYCPETMMGFQTYEEVIDATAQPKTTAQRLADAIKAETPAQNNDTPSVAEALRASMEG